MPMLLLTLRWIAVVAVAILAYVAGWAVVAVGWKLIGGSGLNAYSFAVATSALAGIIAGCFVAPREQLRTAFWLLTGLALFVAVGVLIKAVVADVFSAHNAMNVGWTIAGAFGAHLSLSAAFGGRKVRRRGD